MSDRSTYRGFTEGRTGIPLFSRGWWLDAVCGEQGWDVALVQTGGRIVASLPYVRSQRSGFTYLAQPPLTQCLGPWMAETEAKPARRLSRQMELLSELIARLPDFDCYAQNWHWGQTNWLPFYWGGFEQTTLYTYIIDDLSDEKRLWSGLRENIRTDVRKAANRHGLKVRDDLDVSDFIALNRMVFARQGRPLPYSEDLVRRLDEACRSRSSRAILIAEDGDGRRHAGVYIVWDEHGAYYLMGGGDPELRSSGATSLCLLEAIKRASMVTRRFDFEGSVIEPIERFFRAFGATQTPYFHVSKTSSLPLRIGQFFKRLRK